MTSRQRKNELTAAYKAVLVDVRRVVNDFDPDELVHGSGAPADEWDDVVNLVISRLIPVAEEDAPTALAQALTEAFGDPLTPEYVGPAADDAWRMLQPLRPTA